MEFVRSTSTEKEDYEILIRKRGENDYASYCPQLNFMIKGFDHEQVKEYMSDYIDRHINILLYGAEMPLSAEADETTTLAESDESLDTPAAENSLVLPDAELPENLNNE